MGRSIQPGSQLPAKLPNQFAGINTVLHDDLLSEGVLWEEFHHAHIDDIRRHLNADARFVNMGYEARLVPGLQLRIGAEPRRPRPDVSVYHDPGQDRGLSVRGTAVMGRESKKAPPAEPFELSPADAAMAIAIHSKKVRRGDSEPVAWLELLSPGNLPGGRGWADYREKRLGVLKSGQTLVEIDYLHNAPPVTKEIPSYYTPRGKQPDPDGSPYSVAVSKMVQLPAGKIRKFRWGVDQPLPNVQFPLLGADQADLDLHTVYNHTFDQDYALRARYDRIPQLFDETYRPPDQDRIATRIMTVLDAMDRGGIPEFLEGPLPLDPRLLPDARLRLPEFLEERQARLDRGHANGRDAGDFSGPELDL